MRPIEPLTLPEQLRVLMTIEERPAQLQLAFQPALSDAVDSGSYHTHKCYFWV